MSGPYATRLFRIAFVLAGCYNLAFGLWAGFWPRHFFQLFEIAPPRHAAIWACLGMVVGVYGLLYWYAAWKPERGRPIIAVGLLGKVLGPIGMVLSFSDTWPERLGMLCVYNDLIWWLPFSLFLIRDTVAARRLVSLTPWVCAGLHALGLVAMAVALQGGTEWEPQIGRRASSIVENVSLWRIGWATWMIAAPSLVGFYAWWGARLSSPVPGALATLLASAGMVCDLSGESLLTLVLVERAAPLAGEAAATLDQLASFRDTQRVATLLTAGAANALYTAGGVVLTLATTGLPVWIRLALWMTWLAGAGMSGFALREDAAGMAVTTAILFPLLILWCAWMGRSWKRP